MRTREGPIRTISQIKTVIKIPCNSTFPKYKILETKIKQLSLLGLSNQEIARRLQINPKTVSKAIRIGSS